MLGLTSGDQFQTSGFYTGFSMVNSPTPMGACEKKRAWRLREVCNRQAASPYAIASKETGFD
jgi:hypothetical protein